MPLTDDICRAIGFIGNKYQLAHNAIIFKPATSDSPAYLILMQEDKKLYFKNPTVMHLHGALLLIQGQ